MKKDWSTSVYFSEKRIFINEYIDIEPVEIGSDADFW